MTEPRRTGGQAAALRRYARMHWAAVADSERCGPWLADLFLLDLEEARALLWAAWEEVE